MLSFSSLKNTLVYLIFTVSGATALIYQVIWSRWLTLVFGNTTISTALILATFMSGLAIGSWLAGRNIRRISNPMRAYAFVELGIGIFALCFNILAGITDSVFAALVTTDTSFASGLSIRALLSCFLLLFPTILMGATLPLLTEFFKRRPKHTSSWKVGLLYAANTFGAVIGIFLAGFLLIELIGVHKSGTLAAVLNLIIAAIAFAISRYASKSQDDVQQKVCSIPVPQRTSAICIFTACGALGLASEVLWTRTLESLVGNSTYAFSLIVVLYLVGIAAGSWIMSLIVNRIRNLTYWLATLQACSGIWLIIAILLFKYISNLLAPHWGTQVSIYFLLLTYLKAMFVLLPLSLFSGACFPITTRILNPDSEEADGVLIAKAYSWNTIGAVAGSLAAGFIIAPLFDFISAIYFLAALYSLTSVAAYSVLFRQKHTTGKQRQVIISSAVCAIITLTVSLTNIFSTNSFAENINKRFPLDEVVLHKQGLQGVTTVIKEKGQPLADRLLVNGLGMTSKVTDEKMMAHIPMLLHPAPFDTLVICFGMGTTYRSAISHGMNVTVVELIHEVMQAFDYFHTDAARIRAYERGRMITNDGRNFLKLTRNKYDVITIDPPPPIDAAGVNSLYSRELMQLARSRLKKGGVFAHWVPVPGMSGSDEYTYNLLIATFADVFPFVYMKAGYNNFGLHIIGALEPLNLDDINIETRPHMDQIVQDITEWDPVTPSYFDNITYFQNKPVNMKLLTDDNPQLEFYLLRTLRQGGTKSLIYNYWQ